MYLFFIRRTSLFRAASSAGCVGSAGEEAITTPGAMVLVGAVRIWYVCTSPEAAEEKNSEQDLRHGSTVTWFNYMCQSLVKTHFLD